MNKLAKNTKGFTVVELLVATAVFGVILLVVTVAILQFSRVYYKGVTETNTQETARSIVDKVGQAIQFNGGPVAETPLSPSAGTSYRFCTGNQQYSFRLGRQLVESSPGANQTYHALVVQDLAACPSQAAQDLSVPGVTGTELLSTKMRLADIEVRSVGTNLYRIHVRVVFGDDDLLNNPTATNASCQAHQGSQFCAVSDITTVVTKRVE
jgi:prepilin-type N-terminal cleavage/methylation domain-containing protein